jgi:hypothetical protein
MSTDIREAVLSICDEAVNDMCIWQEFSVTATI